MKLSQNLANSNMTAIDTLTAFEIDRNIAVFCTFCSFLFSSTYILTHVCLSLKNPLRKSYTIIAKSLIDCHDKCTILLHFVYKLS